MKRQKASKISKLKYAIAETLETVHTHTHTHFMFTK